MSGTNLPAVQDTNQFPAMLAHTGTSGTADYIRMVADSSGALLVSGSIVSWSSLLNFAWGSVNVTYPSGTSETYSFYNGTVAVGTVNLTYLDAAKGSLSSAWRS